MLKSNILKKYYSCGAITIILLLLCSKCFSQGYIDYHKSINKIENDFFLKGKSDSTLIEYYHLFNKYDFVFVKDCITAMELAIFLQKNKYASMFAKKAFENGLMLRHLDSIKYVSSSSFYLNQKMSLDSLYKISRPVYLRRIDTAMLNTFTKLYAYDQGEKNGMRNTSEKEYKIQYKKDIQKTIDELLILIKTRGIPSDKLIGINQNDILKELGIPNRDLNSYYSSSAAIYNCSPTQFTFQEEYLSSGMLLPIMWHYSCPYSLFKDYFIKGIENGTIHPRDLACIKDRDFKEGVNSCSMKNDSVYCKIIEEREQSLPFSDSLINKNRESLFIGSLQLDEAKRMFAKLHGMRFAFGWMGIR